MILLWSTSPLDTLSERTAIEDAVLMRLMGLARANGGFLKALRTYNGEIDEENADDILRELAGEAPAILVSTSTGRYDDTAVTARAVTNVVTLDLLLVSTTYSGPKERLRGDIDTTAPLADYGDPGIYYMLAAVRERLMGRALGVEGAGVLYPVTEQILYGIQNFTAWRAVYRVNVRIRQPREGEAEAWPFDELEHRHINFDELAERATRVATGIATPSDD